jgi:hypothetical protein
MIAMRALVVGAIYFGVFIAIGWTAKVLLRYVMNQYGADLADVQDQAGERRQTREVFLLGAWRKEK